MSDDCVFGVAEEADTPALAAFLASPEYFAFAALIVAAYVLVAAISWRETVRNLKHRSLRANNAQVAVLLGIGATVRAGYYVVQFLANEWIRELLLAITQIVWVAAFTLIVMYWMEMQTTMRRIHSVHTYTRHLWIILVVYTCGRILQGVFRHVCGRPAEIVTLILTFLVYFFYVVLFAFAAFWSWRLWRRMVRMNKTVRSRTQSAFLQRKLRKLTRLIVLEVISAALLMLTGLLRWYLRGNDPGMRTNDPGTYLLVGLPEYLTEYALVIVLCFAIVVGKSDKERQMPPSSTSSEMSTARRSTVVKSSPLVRAKKPTAPPITEERASQLSSSPGSEAAPGGPILNGHPGPDKSRV